MKIKIEQWLNARKKLATTIFTTSSIIAIAIVWVGYDNTLEIKTRTILEWSIPNAQAKEVDTSLEVLKDTPMEEAIPHILEASKYYEIPTRYYLCVANAESSFKNFPKDSYNPFGIKPNSSLKGYQDWEHSINGFSQLLKYYYLNEGRTTAEQIMPKYVGYNSQDWVSNCNKYLKVE